MRIKHSNFEQVLEKGDAPKGVIKRQIKSFFTITKAKKSHMKIIDC